MATLTQTDAIPELVDGDRMDSAEFERRYVASPHIKKAELVEGVVYVASPVSDVHSEAHSGLYLWIGFYQVGTPGLASRVDGTVRLDESNQPQPDIHLRIAPGHGGQTTISADHYVEGAPELVSEISVSTKSLDLNERLEAYRRNGALEYIVWRVLDRAIDWFVLREGRYERLKPGSDGLLRSEVFPGLWLDAAALIRGDLATVLAVVQLGMATPEHSAFVDRLRGTATEGDRP